MVGTLAGGGLLAAPGLLEASRPCQEWGCDSRVAGAAAAVVGYVVGGALGAQYAATVQTEKPPFSRVLLASVFGAIAGGIVWNRIGTTFEPRDPTVVDYRSWYWGAAAGIALHLTATSLVAQRSVRLPPVIYPVPAPPIPGPQAAESRRPGPPPGALPRVGARVRECER